MEYDNAHGGYRGGPRRAAGAAAGCLCPGTGLPRWAGGPAGRPRCPSAATSAAVLALLDEAGSPATVASGGPRYFGFVTGGALPVAQAAAWLITAWDQNAALSVMSPAASMLTGVALRWVTELLGLPAGTGGGFVTGATMANATCLAAARDAVLTRHGWDAAGL